MFQIMPLLPQCRTSKAQAEANFAEIEYLNTKQLADSNVVSKNELALAKPNLTRPKLNKRLGAFGLYWVARPFDGIMDRFPS